MDLVSRVKGILLTPTQEWNVIDTEPATVAGLYSEFIIPMAAIRPVCAFIGGSIIGVEGVKVPMGAGITSAIVAYVMALVGVYIISLIIDAVAPTFGGQKSKIQALKVAAYSSTASWAAGVFSLLSATTVLGLLGLYSLYLLYVGLPTLMKTPADKAMGYTVVVVICVIVVMVVIGMLAALVVPGGMIGYSRLRP